MASDLVLRSIADENVAGKRVLVRVDFNVPLSVDDESGQVMVSDDTRIRASLETISWLQKNDATVVICSHLGRPKGVRNEAFSLAPVSARLEQLLERPVHFVDDCVGEEVERTVNDAEPGDVILLENTRFHPQETENDSEFSRQLARLCDLYVNDAFGTVHRANASTAGVANYVPAFAGFLLGRELHNLSALIANPARPFVTIIGGLKVSDKIGVLKKLSEIADAILVGGAMAFTFHAARGVDTGASRIEDEDGQSLARDIMKTAEENGCSLMLPVDVVVAQEISPSVERRVVAAESIPAGWMGLDIGPRTQMLYSSRIAEASTIFWNGPMGVFEVQGFEDGTRGVAEAVAASHGTSVIGGGDSVAAANKFGVAARISHISTGGGASLALLEGATLPGVEAIRNSPE